ncbi:NAD(P)-binding protein [Venturia nashicola]|nr:NAD(P)-binding protein [Venturia nashicola]
MPIRLFTVIVYNSFTMFPIWLQLFGLFFLGAVACRILVFINLYFLQASKIDRYLRADGKAWALVTGASEGIGSSLVQALCDKGFNVILHSRNEEKLARRIQQLEKKYPHRRCVGFTGDAADVLRTVNGLFSTVENIQQEGGRLTVLVNNVGGAGLFGVPTFSPLTDVPLEVAMKQIDLNAKFPTLLTRALLPTMTANGKALVLNISSYAGVYGDPYVSIYAATKAFNNIFSTSLSYELRVLHPSLEVLGIVLGGVLTAGNPLEKLGFASLTSDEAAGSIIARVGCGKGVVAASWKQCLLGESAKWMPEPLARWALTLEIQKRMGWEVEQKSD